MLQATHLVDGGPAAPGLHDRHVEQLPELVAPALEQAAGDAEIMRDGRDVPARADQGDPVFLELPA